MSDYLTESYIDILFVLVSIVIVSLWFVLNRITKLSKGKITGIAAMVGFLPFCSIFAWALFPIRGRYSLLILGIPVVAYFIGPFYWQSIEGYQEMLKQADEIGKPYREKRKKDKLTKKR